ncbi:S8 family serine peptidase [Hyphomicrobium sp. LHD-15]|uniref:S8 family serine peptidase n=1 Tax=Hyphomicrobium sp. LHD-15 TaxID=3072142 RepID=UPI0028101328|nr:S8 family serine peptidase [Hyphomicrobium sp. LHD-15]MDQ8697103.1 S8 family serine peptidase [Hyphomicrobium sp. LHD-15]
MSSAVTNSALALNESAWAKLSDVSLVDGMRFAVGGGDLAVFGARPVLAPGGGASVAFVPTTTTASTEAAPTDHLFEQQWHFAWLGDIQKIWEEYTGLGVKVGIHDDGMDATYIDGVPVVDHPDLAANYDASLEAMLWGFMHVDPYPTGIASTTGLPFYDGAQHGTAVAGLIAAARNGVGTVGVAYDVTFTTVDILSGHKMTDINTFFDGFLEAAYQTTNFDVVNHSWGDGAYFFQENLDPYYYWQGQATVEAWMSALDNGRDGLGTIQVKAAGNQNLNANGTSSSSSRATIIVGAFDDDGDASYYSNHGSNLLVSAPSSGFANILEQRNAGLVTTDRSGAYAQDGGAPWYYGYNGFTDENGNNTDTDYTPGFGGTSGATPIVTGVIALMLQANENLGWRDVQNILAYSAHEQGSGVGGDKLENESNRWFYNNADNWNGGGLHFSNDYGFGGVDAYNAVRMAEVWSLFGGPKASANESSYSQTMTEGVALEDGKTTDIKFTFDGGEFAVDFVNVEVVLSHELTDDLEIILISPDGTEIRLIDFNLQWYYGSNTGWKAEFGVNAFRGEDGAGEWTLRIVDHWVEDAGTLDSVKITLHGADGEQAINDLTADVYHYTNEVFESLARDGSRLTLTDSDGGKDWINAAAIASNLVIRLEGGASSTAGGVEFVRIAAGTDIENAVTGDGNDELYGNNLDNRLHGMRGNDMLFGGAGNDTLSGGAGNDRLTGGVGADNFLFDRALNAATNVDIITDFSHIDDSIWLDASIFTSLAALIGSSLVSTMFYLGNEAADSDDYVLYDLATGSLYYDADGSGADSIAILFAVFEAENIPLDLSFDDFRIVSAAPDAMGQAQDRPDGFNPVEVSSEVTDGLRGLVDEEIIGTNEADVIYAKSANDRIFGKGGDDVLSGGGGDDYIDGGAGSDEIYGGDGNDTLIGGGSNVNTTGGPLLRAAGETIYGGRGNDFIQGSNQLNDFTLLTSGQFGDDQLVGEWGDDIIYGLDGDDIILGDNHNYGTVGGNDILYGGAGSDYIEGGFGDDRIYAGTGVHNEVYGGTVGGYIPALGVDGIDTVVFEGRYEDYRITGLNGDFILVERTTPGDVERTLVQFNTVERFEFTDRTLDQMVRPLVYVHDLISGSGGLPNPLPDVAFTADDYEVAAFIGGANDVNLQDVGAENGGKDRLQFVTLDGVKGDTVISSDAVTSLSVYNHGSGSITVDAHQVGDRTLQFFFLGVDLADGQRITDDAATHVIFYDHGFAYQSYMNGAGDDDYNLSFASAESIRFKQNDGTLALKWYIPLVSEIDMRTGALSMLEVLEGQNNSGNGPYGSIFIETALDDSAFATAGGSEEFRFYGGDGREFVQLGNIGTGATSEKNTGQGLKGQIDMGGGSDEVWLLGAGAIDGGTIDGGDNPVGSSDVIRMSFTTAAAIADISGSISNFESVQFDVDAGSHTVNADKFDDLLDIRVMGTSGTAGNNTVELAEGSLVTFKAMSTATNFGTVNLVGGSSALNILFADKFTQTEDYVGLPAGRPDYDINGIVHIADATAVNITTMARTDYTPNLRALLPFYPDFTLPRENSFEFALVLDNATTVTLTGNVGWDFTIAGTDISHVTTIDASGVTGTGIAGGVIVHAMTDTAVSFTGGAGYDTFKGGAGSDTFVGGNGFDTVIFNGNFDDYVLTVVDGNLVVSGLDSGNDTLIGIERIVFNDIAVAASLDGQGAPYDIILSDVVALPEYAETGTVVATLSAADPNTGETFAYSLVNDFQGAFRIEGNQIVVANGLKLEFEARNYADFTVQVTDSTGRTFEKQFRVEVTDVEPEHYIGTDAYDEWFGGYTDDYFEGHGGDDYTFAESGNDILNGGAGNDLLQGGYGTDTAIYSGNRADYTFEQPYPQYPDYVIITDNRDGSPDGTDQLSSIEFLQFADGTFALADLLGNAAPTDILPDEASVAENSADGTVVAELSAVDPDSGDTHTFELVNNAGGRFAIVDGKLVVADSTGLDYEAATSHEVVVRVTDSAGNSIEQTIVVNVTDVNDTIPPTVTLTNRVASLAETTPTLERVKVADIVITNGSTSTGTLSLVGRDRALFEIVGLALFLKAGAALDAKTLKELQVAVAFDEPAYPGSPDATTDTYKLAINDVRNVAMVHGTAASETVTGTKSNDYIDGHGGDDVMRGGKGNDTYVVDSAGDQVVESRSQGTDTVHASVSHTLSANVENLTLFGTGDLDGTGNASNNVIIGNAGNNTLSGEAGDDTLYGGAGNDRLFGGSGKDKLYGDDGDDWLDGGSGNDMLSGRVGNDTLYGGAGNDKLYGGDGNDSLFGGADNDTLSGGVGTDILEGGLGRDYFVFADIADTVVGAGRDTILDFQNRYDRIDLSGIDANTLKKGNQAFSWLGTAEFTNKAGQLHYTASDDGALVSGDVNGDGVADFEILVKVATLSSHDFVL